MKLAVKNIHGVQTNDRDKLKYYYLVDYNYNFSGNSATDVTSIGDLGLFKNNLRLNHPKYIKSLNEYSGDNPFSGLTHSDKVVLARYFIVDKTKRDEVLTQQQQDDFNYYKIYDFISDDVIDRFGRLDISVTPKSIDYKKDVNQRFHSEYEFDNKGFLINTTYYENLDIQNVSGMTTYNYTSPIVHYNAQYFQNSDGYVTQRIVTRKWELKDGTWSIDDKVTNKYYDTKSSREEGNRRRRNLINNLLIDTVGLFFITSGDLTSISETESDAIPFLTEVDSGIKLYYESGAKEDINGNPCLLIQQVSGSTYSRLNNIVPPTTGTTIRDYIISRLNPQ